MRPHACAGAGGSPRLALFRARLRSYADSPVNFSGVPLEPVRNFWSDRVQRAKGPLPYQPRAAPWGSGNKIKALKVRPHFGTLLQSFVCSHPMTQGAALGWYRSHRWCSETMLLKVPYRL